MLRARGDYDPHRQQASAFELAHHPGQGVVRPKHRGIYKAAFLRPRQPHDGAVAEPAERLGLVRIGVEAVPEQQKEVVFGKRPDNK